MLQAQDREYPAQKLNSAEAEIPVGHQSPSLLPTFLEFSKFLLLYLQPQKNCLFAHFAIEADFFKK